MEDSVEIERERGDNKTEDTAKIEIDNTETKTEDKMGDSLEDKTATRDLVQHYRQRWDDETQIKDALSRDVESTQGDVANTRRTRQWLESRLDRVVHALATREATAQYLEERVDPVEGVTGATLADLADERRLRAKLEETVDVMERAREAERYKRRLEEVTREIAALRGTLEVAQIELYKEKETVHVLRQTVEDLERAIVEENAPDAESQSRLDEMQREFVEQRAARTRLERKLVELEESMCETGEVQRSESAGRLERVQDELMVERKLRMKLQRRLAAAAENRQRGSEEGEDGSPREEENTLQSLLKCTLDKLAGERKVRRTLEERLAVLESAVRKEQAKTKFEEMFLTLTQNELSEERETRLTLERQLVEVEARKAEMQAEMEVEAKKVEEAKHWENFDAKLEALDKIINNIQVQNQFEQEEIDGGGKSAEGIAREDSAWVEINTEQSTTGEETRPRRDQDLGKGRWHIVDELAESPSPTEVEATSETVGYEQIELAEEIPYDEEESAPEIEATTERIEFPEEIPYYEKGSAPEIEATTETNGDGRIDYAAEIRYAEGPIVGDDDRYQTTEDYDGDGERPWFDDESPSPSSVLLPSEEEVATRYSAEQAEIERNIMEVTRELALAARSFTDEEGSLLEPFGGGTPFRGGTPPLDEDEEGCKEAKLAASQDKLLADSLVEYGAMKRKPEPDAEDKKNTDDPPDLF